MAYKRFGREPIRRTEPLYRTLTYVARRMGLIEPSDWREARREDERAPRGRRR